MNEVPIIDLKTVKAINNIDWIIQYESRRPYRVQGHLDLNLYKLELPTVFLATCDSRVVNAFLRSMLYFRNGEDNLIKFVLKEESSRHTRFPYYTIIVVDKDVLRPATQKGEG